MYNPPDRPLIVKCTFDKWHKRITFSSARNCSYDLLRRKVEQCFSLYGSTFSITYKDDDGEITNISTDGDLVEGIQYFQAGDDAPTSSAASILSGRSFGPRKITLRVEISVDYDGPSLSDTSSLASLDDFKARNGSQQSFSFGTPSIPEVDDDSVTVSSRDPGTSSTRHRPSLLGSERSISKQKSSQSWETSKTLAEGKTNGKVDKGKGTAKSSGESVNGSFHASSLSERYPADPSAIFERLKARETLTDTSSVDVDHLTASERGAAWLRDQNERAIRSKLGALPEPSETDSLSMSLESQDDLGGDLALERDPRGKYYYTYTSGSSASQAHGSIYEEVANGFSERDSYIPGGPPRPTSMQLNWLASQRIKQPILESERPPSVAEEPPQIESQTIDPEVLPFIPAPGPPPDLLTDCSNCGVILDAIRYVCASCGPKPPVSSSPVEKGKAKECDSPTSSYSYPPKPHPLFTYPQGSASSQTLIGGESQDKPLPSLPPPLPPMPTSLPPMPTSFPPMPPSLPPMPSSMPPMPTSMPPLPSSIRSRLAQTKPHLDSLSSPSSPSKKAEGYELCALCLETVGVHHAIEAGFAGPGLSPIFSSNDDSVRASQWRRAPPKKGQLRHAYKEKAWGHNGWEDVVLDEARVSQCSTCSAITERKRYKCTSCEKMLLCRACYSQVHELHPSHAFLTVPDKPVETTINEEFNPSTLTEAQGEHSLMHPGVKCSHCLLDIVGARFHCAICSSVDICSNCESAGLPGNLDSADGGHISSHILIKIPYPLENTELQSASRRALHLWTGRDAANVAFGNVGPKAASEISSYAQTMIGIARDRSEDHRLWCNGCQQLIVGVRYQCGHCPSKPTAYNLCSTCEPRSYQIHDPLHVFFKLPRPVHQPLEAAYPFLPPLYKTPVGPAVGAQQSNDPKSYLSNLVHSSALCDRCMIPIQGEWFRCCYCARDLCDACEDVDTHNNTHIFIVFKSTVDMHCFKSFANLDNHGGSSPIIPYPVYR